MKKCLIYFEIFNRRNYPSGCVKTQNLIEGWWTTLLNSFVKNNIDRNLNFINTFLEITFNDNEMVELFSIDLIIESRDFRFCTVQMRR